MDDISVGLRTAKAQSETQETCATCGRPLTQRGSNGECLRCLVSLTFLGDGEQPERPAARSRLTPGPLRYAHFEVETGADGFPIELGAGAMAITYRARDTVLNSFVALKVIDRKVAQNPGARSRFLREARAAANIHHPNVARVTYYGEQDGECFYAMELVEGETLEARVRRDGPMSLDVALDVVEQAARALVAAEACGVVHRDIKPSNVMLESDPTGALRVKLIDYGVAKVMGPQTQSSAEQTHAGFIGTPAFASPEQFAGAGQLPVDTRSDIYSLGVTLWYLLTGRTPFVGRTMEEIRARQTTHLPLEQLKRLHLPGRVVALLKSMLVADPNHRPQSARELLLAVHSCSDRFNVEARRRRRKAIIVNVALMLAIVAIACGTWLYQRLRPFTPEERSIAVLPFENLSSDKENAYFAEGVQDEILTRLSKIANLKVISRTSTQHYQSTPKNLREIAKQLGVAHILEGSVQKSADTVRVNVQLIKATSDSHVWSDTFDRKLTDILSVETEVAKTIADQLRAKLTGDEQQVIAAKPTNNPQAYDSYLRGLAYALKTAFTPENSLGAQKYVKEAVRLDPNFALGWALLSYVDASGYLTQSLQPTVALREEAREAAETALRLQPNLGEALLAMGFYHYACLKDYDTALKYLVQAQQVLPQSSRVLQGLAFIERRRGNWDKSEAYFQQAEKVDPRNVNLLSQHARSYICLRRFPEALAKLEQILNINPDDIDTIVLKARIAQAQGDLPRAAALLAPLRLGVGYVNALETQIYQGILESRPGPVIAQLKEILAKPDKTLGFYAGELRFWLGWAQQVAGDHAAARQSWSQARTELESFLNEQPENFFLMGDLALTNAALGDNNAALSLAERAMEMIPIEKDALTGPRPLEILARVAARTGDVDRSISALEKLLSIPYEAPLAANPPLTPAFLRLDPMFQPLRKDPRFQKLANAER
ncbi:MAG TPA: protein kinase [Candidatus Udaeobacter sp.]|nr:protein kinase [Candidatus Udaeobacter sp.]